MREALTLLLDFEWTNKQLFNGAYSRTKSYFDNSEMASSGLPSAEELKILEPLRGRFRIGYSPRLFSYRLTTAAA